MVAVLQHPSGLDLIERVREATGDTTLLAFSRGKDSIGAWLAIRDHFEVRPFFKVMVPGLEFVEESLAYYEKWFGTRIERVMHTALPRWLTSGVFQTPGHALDVAGIHWPRKYGEPEARAAVLALTGVPEHTMTATGVRAADSTQRRTAITQHGVMNLKPKHRVYHPIWDWNKARLVTEIRRSGVALPIDYRIWGRTFDGLTVQYVAPLKRHLPDDYRRVVEMFPLIDIETWRYERAKAA